MDIKNKKQYFKNWKILRIDENLNLQIEVQEQYQIT